MRIETVNPADITSVVDELGQLLIDCVADGAGVGFARPLPLAAARDWWRDHVDGRTTFAAICDDDRIVGAVQLVPASPPNGRHRAEVAKLLVAPAARRQGIGTALLTHLESAAFASGRWLLVLDTQAGTPAERLYERFRWQRVGVVKDYALTVDGELSATVIFSKDLRLPPTSTKAG